MTSLDPHDCASSDTLLCLVTQSCPTLCDRVGWSPLGSSVHGDSPGKNTGVGCRALLQGIFPTQGANLGLPHCRWILYHLRHQGNIYIHTHIYIHNFICIYYLSMHLLMDISVASMSWLFWIVLLWTRECIYLFKLPFCLVICPEVGLLDHMVSLFLVFWVNLSAGFWWWLHQFTLPPAVAEHSLFSTPSPTIICRLKWWLFWPVWGGTSL